MRIGTAVVMALFALHPGQEDKTQELRELRKAIRAKEAEAAPLRPAAHEALDRGEYERAMENHKKAKALENEVVGLKKREGEILTQVVNTLLKDLEGDDVQVRDRAASVLVTLGPRAIPVLEAVKEGAPVEARSPLRQAIATLREMDERDDPELLHQWAADAKASSEYSSPDWGARQATGKPDTMRAGDSKTAWASVEADGGKEWLELSYRQAVHPVEVRVRETFSPGAVVKIEAQDTKGEWRALWQGKDDTSECPGWLHVRFAPPMWVTRVIKITLDTGAVPGWNEIDAVELIGVPPEPKR